MSKTSKLHKVIRIFFNFPNYHNCSGLFGLATSSAITCCIFFLSIGLMAKDDTPSNARNTVTLTLSPVSSKLKGPVLGGYIPQSLNNDGSLLFYNISENKSLYYDAKNGEISINPVNFTQNIHSHILKSGRHQPASSTIDPFKTAYSDKKTTWSWLHNLINGDVYGRHHSLSFGFYGTNDLSTSDSSSPYARYRLLDSTSPEAPAYAFLHQGKELLLSYYSPSKKHWAFYKGFGKGINSGTFATGKLSENLLIGSFRSNMTNSLMPDTFDLFSFDPSRGKLTSSREFSLNQKIDFNAIQTNRDHLLRITSDGNNLLARMTGSNIESLPGGNCSIFLFDLASDTGTIKEVIKAPGCFDYAIPYKGGFLLLNKNIKYSNDIYWMNFADSKLKFDLVSHDIKGRSLIPTYNSNHNIIFTVYHGTKRDNQRKIISSGVEVYKIID